MSHSDFIIGRLLSILQAAGAPEDPEALESWLESVRTASRERSGTDGTEKYILHEAGDGGPDTFHICSTEEERDRLTVALIFGDDEEFHGQVNKCLETLRETGALHFEGDPPIFWRRGFVGNNVRPEAELSFQSRVAGWLLECFGEKIAGDTLERSDRFIEEALELVQATGYCAPRAHALVDYVFDRAEGEPQQEVGGVMVTLAALCFAQGLDMQKAGGIELERILQPEIVEKIRRKQASKPVGSALPVPVRG